VRVAQFDTGRDWRGGQAQVLSLMRGLRARGHSSLLFAPAAPLSERASAEGFEARRWRPLLEWDLLAIAAAAVVLRRRAIEIVHCHTARAHASGALAARIVGLPVVVSRRVPLPVRANPLSALKYRVGVERYLCVSRSVMETMRCSGIPEERLALVPSGIDPDELGGHDVRTGARGGATDLRALVGAPPDAPVVGTVGSLTAEKDHAILLDAAVRVMGRIRGVHFVWMGEGEMRDALEKRCAVLGLGGRVHLLGFRPDARQLMRQLTLLAQPSRFEGLGNAILEAQAAGIAVVATAVGGVPELIEDGAGGRLVPPGDAEALAAALIEALEDPAMRARWGERGAASVRGFSAERMVELTLEQYREALGAPGRA